MPFSSPAQSIALDIVTPQRLNKSPFLNGQPIRLFSNAGASVYGVKRPASGDTTNFACISFGHVIAGDPIDLTDFDLDDRGLLAMDDQADPLTADNILRVVLIKNPHIDGGTLLLRVGNDITPATGQFCQTDTVTLVLGDDCTVNDQFELWVLEAADITRLTGGALTARQIYDSIAYDVVVATALTNITPAGIAG